MKSLKGDPSPFAQNTYNTLMSKSPMSLAVTFRQLKYEGPPLTFQERMKMEFRLSQHFVEGHDFMEGVQAPSLWIKTRCLGGNLNDFRN